MAMKARHVSALKWLKPTVTTHVAKGTPLKKRLVGTAKEIFASRGVMVLNMRAAATGEVNTMRADLAVSGGALKFVKNSLARRAAAELAAERAAERGGGVAEVAEGEVNLGSLLHGTVGLLYTAPECEDPLAVFKAAVKLEEKNEAVAILGGSLDGTLLTRGSILGATQLPPLAALRGDLIGTLLGPSHNLASALSAPKLQVAAALTRSLEAPATKFARAASQHKDQLEQGGKEGGGAPQEAEPGPTA